MDSRENALQNFSSCPLCGYFLSTLLAVLGDKSLDKALQDSKGGWLEFEWQSSLGEALTRYYDWRFETGVERHAGRCPSCKRRLEYRLETEGAILRIERRPGYRA